MPDYAFEGPGVRLEGTTDGKAAQKAGLQRGDVILKLGKVEVKDVMGYMGALAQFKPGDTTTVEYKRGDAVQTVDIQF
jgi:S1-C subfamily serine protease